MSNVTPVSGNGNLSVKQWARIYTGLGLELLPLHPSTKKPTSPSWQTHQGVRDPERADFVFMVPEQNVGFKPGDRFVVIDIDTKHGGRGRESWASVNERFGQLPETVEAVTASGGGLLIYRLPEDAGLSLQAKMLGLPDLEFRTGQVNCVLPPSRIEYKAGEVEDGVFVGQHRWIDGKAPGEIEIAELPPEVIEAVRAYQPAGEATRSTKVGGGGSVATYLDAEFKAHFKADFRPAEFAPIREGCAFVRHAGDEATEVELEWYHLLTITGRCRDGEKLSHLVSEGYSGYSPAETDAKLAQALTATGPISCAEIEGKGFAGCARCPFRGVLKGPLDLGQLPPKPRDPRTKEVTPWMLAKRAEIQAGMVYGTETGQVFIPETGEVVSRKTFADRVRAEIGRDPMDALLSWKTTPRAAKFDYLPGETRLMIKTRSKFPTCNIWVPGGVEASDGTDTEAARPLVEHFEMLLPDERTRNHVLDYIAHLAQRPTVKIKSVVILTGDEGYGKSTVGDLIEILFGKTNTGRIAGGQLASKFKDGLVNHQVSVVEEANHGERFEVTEAIKEWLTAETMKVEGKGIPFHTGRTPRGVFIYSNHEAPLVIGPMSRRFFIGATTRKLQSSEYFRKLYATLDDPAATGAFKRWLLMRDISGFDAQAEPFRTGARDAAEEASRTPLGQVLGRMIEERTGPFYRDVVLMREVEDALGNPRWAGMVGPINIGKVAAAMKQIGARKVGVAPDGKHRRIYLPNGKQERLWAVRNVRELMNADDDTLKTELLRIPEGATNVTSMVLVEVAKRGADPQTLDSRHTL